MMITTVDRIMQVWRWCSVAYLRHGRHLCFPKHTDPTKTYQWRYLEALNKKLLEWDLDDTTSQRFIDAAVAYAKERKLMSKGLSIFLQSNILETCYDRLSQDDNRIDQIIRTLEQTRNWLLGMAKNRPLPDLLLARGIRGASGVRAATGGIGAYANIVKWYQAGELSELYLSLSRSCMTALARLAKTSQNERQLLPPATKLFITRSAFLSNAIAREQTRPIFGDDWRSTCL